MENKDMSAQPRKKRMVCLKGKLGEADLCPKAKHKHPKSSCSAPAEK